jgi:hypothetical protein
MQIQASTASVTGGLARPEGFRPSPSRGSSRIGAGEGASVTPEFSGTSRSPEAQAAADTNFAEEARPTRNLPRGSLVNLVI